MKDDPLVSIIVPVYNISGYVLKCLNSIKKQSYSNLEIIIVDDGSTDDSGKICDEFCKDEKRAKVFHKKNGGLSSARNFGMNKSKGKIIAFIDGDDYVEVNFIKTMQETMVKDGSDIVVCGYNDVLPERKVLDGELATARLLIEQENIDIIACNKIYKKELFINNSIEYPEGYKYEDSLTTYKIMAVAKKVSYISQSLYNYIDREDSIMGQNDVVERLKTREKAARESAVYFAKNEFLKQAAEIAILTAKYAFMDAVIHKEIDRKYFKINADWVNKNKLKYKKNKAMTKKLKLYNFLNQAGLYKIFRTIV